MNPAKLGFAFFLAFALASGASANSADDGSSGPDGARNGAVTAAPATGRDAVRKAPLGVWQLVTGINTARSRTDVVYFPGNGKYYLLGGEASGSNRDIPIEEYDPDTNTWTDRTPLDPGVSNSGAARVGKFIYVPGGFTGVTGSAVMQRFDPVTNTVTPMAALPAANYAHAVASVGKKVFVMGGSDTGAAGTTNYIYDAKLDTWTVAAPVPIAVQYPAAVSNGKFVYLIGGNTANLDIVQRYNPGNNKWKAMAPMGTGRGGPGAFFDGDTIRAVGGGWNTYLTSTESYDIGANSWSPGLDVNVGARTFGVAYGNTMALKAGGWNGGYLDAAEILRFKKFRPDGQIKTSGNYAGNNVYNSTGKKQTKQRNTALNQKAVFRIRLQNDGNVRDRVRVAGQGDKPGFVVRYFKGANGGANITGKVKNGKYKTAKLKPGKSAIVRMEVSVLFNAVPGTTKAWKVTAKSNREPALSDTVKAKVRATLFSPGLAAGVAAGVAADQVR